MYKLSNPEYLLINQSYGGHQKWLSEYGYLTSFQANHSCAISAASNYLYYLKNKYDLASLSYKQTQLGFTHQMNELYHVMQPRYWGIPRLNRFKNGFLKYTNSLDLHLMTSMIKKGTKEDYLSFIKQELKKDYPILMLTLFSPNKSLSYHWVTITALLDLEESPKLIISNWGRKESVDFHTWYDQSIGKGLIAFNLKQDAC